LAGIFALIASYLAYVTVYVHQDNLGEYSGETGPVIPDEIEPLIRFGFTRHKVN
jgi:hypothetical protein